MSRIAIWIGLCCGLIGLSPAVAAAIEPASMSVIDQQTELYQLLNQGVEQFRLSEFQAALDSWQRCLEMAREMGNRAVEADTLGNLGSVYFELGDYAIAIEFHQQALILAREMDNRSLEANTLGNLGSIYEAVSEYSTAIDFHQQALAIAQEPTENPTEELQRRQLEANTLGNLGNVYFAQGNYLPALDAYEQQFSIAQMVNDRLGESSSLGNQGNIYVALGQYVQAIEVYERSLNRAREIGNRQLEAIRLNNLGSVYLVLGQPEDASIHYQQAVDLAQDIGDRSTEASALINLGVVDFSLGDYSQAIDRYQQALTRMRELGDRLAETNILENLGSLYLSLGDYSSAIDLYQQQLDIARAIGARQSEANALGSLGSGFDALEEYEQAIHFFRSQLVLNRELDNPQGKAFALSGLASAYRELEQYHRSVVLDRRSLRISRQIGDRSGEASRLVGLADSYQAQGKSTSALRLYQQALVIQRDIENEPAQGYIYSRIGRLLAQTQPELAILFYKRSINIAEAIRQNIQALPDELQQSFVQAVAADTYRELADLLIQQNRVLEAQVVLDLLKVQELEDYLHDVRGSEQISTELDYSQSEEAILALYDRAIDQGLELAQLRDIPMGDRTPDQQERLAELLDSEQQLVQSFDAFINSPEIVELVNQLSATSRQQNLNLRDLNALQDNLRDLNQNAVLLYPLILDDRLELILVTPYAPPIRRTVAVSQEEFNQAIVSFRQELVDRRYPSTSSAEQLYEWLIQPIEPDLVEADAETLIYAPDGILRYVPLAALYDGDQWLIQRFRVNYITAASLTDFNAQPLPALRILAGAFADSDSLYSVQVGTRQFNFVGLPFAGLEVETIASEIPNTTTLMNEDFSREATLPLMDDHTIVHLATHAQFVSGTPEESFILFGNGDRITLRDLSTWTLRNVDLVVLSACQTALGGELGNGEEILGFGYQLQRTGARSAIASLWSVDDGGTQVLMNTFYALLEQGNLTKAEALRQTQIAMLTGNYPVPEAIDTWIAESPDLYSHPYYWAPFILIGNGL